MRGYTHEKVYMRSQHMVLALDAEAGSEQGRMRLTD